MPGAFLSRSERVTYARRIPLAEREGYLQPSRSARGMRLRPFG